MVIRGFQEASREEDGGASGVGFLLFSSNLRQLGTKHRSLTSTWKGGIIASKSKIQEIERSLHLIRTFSLLRRPDGAEISYAT